MQCLVQAAAAISCLGNVLHYLGNLRERKKNLQHLSAGESSARDLLK